MATTTNQTFSGVGATELSLTKYTNVLHVSVQNASISISVDKGANFLTLLAGFHTLHLGVITSVQINGSGTWQILATEALSH